MTFEKITYLIGVNAVGKTTILDAIRYCLTTNKDFNALGNRKSARTLQGSVRGKQRGENAYTRYGHTVSYIGVEFLDQKAGKYFVITVRVESESPEQEMRHVRQTWYISPDGVRLENLPFLDQSTHAPSSRDKFCISTGRMPPIDRQSEAKNMICQRLGIGKSDSPLGKKFSSVFPMGTSLDEIHDFRTFIYEYILPQPDMDLDALQKDEQELENLQETLFQAQRRAERLREIVELGDQAVEKERDVCINRGFILFAQYQSDALEQTQLLAYREKCTDFLQRLEKQYDEAQQQAETAHTAYQQAWKAVQDSDEGKFLEVLQQKAKERCRERFRRDILYRMKDDIRNARRQFRELSRIMQELLYGEEMYQFQIRESQDSENGRLYALIMSERNEQMTQEDSLFNMAAMSDQAYEAQIDEFVEQILSAAKDAAQARQNGKRADKQTIQLVDYRQYLDYDIIITNTKTGDTVPLSKVSQDSSGGENQAPFYIAICASLLQIYQKCDNSIRLVLLDEAFSKMTSDRIKPMMKMFRQMDLQVLLITTVEKASAIQPMCDVTYSIVKSGSRNSIAPFYLEVNDDGV